jgi:hypothetical protein
MPAFDVTFPLFGVLEDAAGLGHPAFHDGVAWAPLGDIELGNAEQLADVTVGAGATVAVASVDVNFAGVGTICEVTADLPEVDFTATSGGEAVFSVNVAGTDHAIGHMHGDRSLGWPARFARRLPVPGAGLWTFTLNAQSVAGALTLHADADTLYGPISLTVAVVGVASPTSR